MPSVRKPSVCERVVRNDCAEKLGTYPNRLAASRTRCWVAAGIPELGVPLRTTEAVVTETPASSATSRSRG
jgi:hypothetical protein